MGIRKLKKSTLAFAVLAIVVLATGFFVRAVVVQPYVTPSGVMEETVVPGDHILVNTAVFGFQVPFTDWKVLELRTPMRGDVIVYRYPDDPRKEFVSRIVGLPGDVVQGLEKQLFVNGRPYTVPNEIHKEDNLVPKELNPRDSFGPVTVKPGCYFVMGDNRDRSYDSRFWGCLKRENITGLVMGRYWPLGARSRSGGTLSLR